MPFLIRSVPFVTEHNGSSVQLSRSAKYDYTESPMDKRSVYLDHQTTTPVLEEALQAMLPYFREAYGSPSSLHRFGLQVREGLKEARAADRAR